MVWRFSLFSTLTDIPGIFIISWPVSDVIKSSSLSSYIFLSHIFLTYPVAPSLHIVLYPGSGLLPWESACAWFSSFLRWTEGTGETAVLGSASLLWKDTAAFTWARPGLLVPHNLYWWHDLHVDDMSGFPVDNVLLYASSSITSTSAGRLSAVSINLWQ